MNKSYIIRKNEDIEKVIRNHKTVGNKYFVIYYLKSNSFKVAFSVSKKLGCAVLRNRQKRILREIVRNHMNEINNYMLLIVVKRPSIDLEYSEKENQINILFKKIKKENEQ